MKIIDFVRPGSIENARVTLHELGEQGMPIAGGTALHFLKNQKPVTVVDISGLGFKGIADEKNGYRIGATTPLADIQEYRAERWAFHEVTRRLATHQIRNVSTLGGNIACVFPWSDLPVSLLALDATITIHGDKTYEMPATKFFEKQPARFLRTQGDIVSDVFIPKLGAHTGFGYHKEVRTMSGFSQMTMATVMHLEGDTIQSVRVAAGGALPIPQRLAETEEALTGQTADANLFQSIARETTKDIPWRGKEGMSEEYSRHLASIVLNDVLTHALNHAKERT
jgi:CO/xanthine dehydrogenase FAD-binding subunit